MKRFGIPVSLLLTAALVFALYFPASAENSQPEPLPLTYEMRTVLRDETQSAEDPEASYVRYPEFSSRDPALSPVMEAINRAIWEKARIREYLDLLPLLQPGGAGLKMDCRLGGAIAAGEDGSPAVYGRYVSLLFSTEGKMLRGRPGHADYPMTFDLLTGEEVSFDGLFTDPEATKALIETLLETEVEPTLSTYLENSQLFPVPFDRFYLDSFGHISFYYEADQLSFLSGSPGAVCFRFSELADVLDTSENGVVSQFGYLLFGSRMTERQRGENALSLLRGGKLNFGGAESVWLGEDVSALLSHHHPASDSGYYPGGAYLELETPEYRGAYVLTDAAEETVVGILTSRCDLYELQTGKTALDAALRFLGVQPDAKLNLDAATAEAYLVCPGTAAVCTLPETESGTIVQTLYADEDGVVQYLKLAIKE